MHFSDVVVAYKGLAKEKEALEASLKALTGGSTDKSQGKAPAKKQVDSTEEVVDNDEATEACVCFLVIRGGWILLSLY